MTKHNFVFSPPPGFFADPKNNKAISKLKSLVGKTDNGGNTVLSLLVKSLCELANKTPGYFTKAEELAERREVTLAYFDLILKHLQPDINQLPKITRSSQVGMMGKC